MIVIRWFGAVLFFYLLISAIVSYVHDRRVDQIVAKNLDCVNVCIETFSDDMNRQACYDKCVEQNPLKNNLKVK